METYLNDLGQECVIWTDKQGTHSMTKEAYDLSQVKHLTEIPPQAALSTPIVAEE